ncbi:alpha/beta hydrolase [Nocardioides sp. NPDC051685]|uniref:alpha/beta hydrolase n=1 Tax=Nocardioides sp. NPDC051685 TaxID=3364334 RepID=UPI0037B746CC
MTTIKEQPVLAGDRSALKDLYRSWNERLAASGEAGMAFIRDLYEGWGRYATEAPGVSYESVDVDGVPAIWAIPADAVENSALLFLHGGGFIGGSPTSHRKLAGHIARAAHRRTLIIDYRLAPEHLYPAALEDTLTAFDWLETQGFTPGSIGLVGDSAGGLLATRAAVVRARSGREQAGAVVALSPYYDLEALSDSFDANREVDPIASREGIAENVAAFLPKGMSASDPEVNVLRSDLTGLPPVFVSFGTDEALKGGGQMFTERARAVGVTVVEEELAGMDHVPQFLVGYAQEATDSVAAVGDFLAENLEI